MKEMERIKREIDKLIEWSDTNKELIVKSETMLDNFMSSGHITDEVYTELLKTIEVQKIMQLQIDSASELLNQFYEICEQAIGE